MDKLQGKPIKQGNEGIILGSIVAFIVSTLIYAFISSRIDKNTAKKLEPIVKKYAEKIASSYQRYVEYVKKIKQPFISDVEKSYKGIEVIEGQNRASLYNVMDIKEFTKSVIDSLVNIIRDKTQDKNVSVSDFFCAVDYTKTDFYIEDEDVGNTKVENIKSEKLDKFTRILDKILKKYNTKEIELNDYHWDEATAGIEIDIKVDITPEDIKQMREDIKNGVESYKPIIGNESVIGVIIGSMITLFIIKFISDIVRKHLRKNISEKEKEHLEKVLEKYTKIISQSYIEYKKFIESQLFIKFIEKHCKDAKITNDNNSATEPISEKLFANEVIKDIQKIIRGTFKYEYINVTVPCGFIVFPDEVIIGDYDVDTDSYKNQKVYDKYLQQVKDTLNKFNSSLKNMKIIILFKEDGGVALAIDITIPITPEDIKNIIQQSKTAVENINIGQELFGFKKWYEKSFEYWIVSPTKTPQLLKEDRIYKEEENSYFAMYTFFRPEDKNTNQYNYNYLPDIPISDNELDKKIYLIKLRVDPNRNIKILKVNEKSFLNCCSQYSIDVKFISTPDIVKIEEYTYESLFKYHNKYIKYHVVKSNKRPTTGGIELVMPGNRKMRFGIDYYGIHPDDAKKYVELLRKNNNVFNKLSPNNLKDELSMIGDVYGDNLIREYTNFLKNANYSNKITIYAKGSITVGIDYNFDTNNADFYDEVLYTKPPYTKCGIDNMESSNMIDIYSEGDN